MALRSPYAHLRFATHVDWHHVNPALLTKLETLAANKGVVIDVFSGYRSNEYSAQVGGFRGDPHTHGIAVDASIGGKPIGKVFAPKDFATAGLISGNQPNFYRGKPDPSHVQLGPGQATHDGTAPMATPEQPVPAVQDARQVPEFGTGDYQPPTLLPPGSGPQARQVADWWQQIASQPGAAPETLSWAQNVSSAMGV